MTLYDPGNPGKTPACIFFHIHRTGGNSIRQALQMPRRRARQLIGAHVPARDILAHFEARQQRGLFNAAVKFSVVRNPFDWLVSTYAYLSQSGGPPQDAQGKPMPFPKFIRYYIEERMQRPRAHGSNAAELFTRFLSDDDGIMLTDHILRFEHLDRDASRLLKLLGYAERPVPHVNASRHGAYREYYDDTARGLVTKHFAADLERFSYSF